MESDNKTEIGGYFEHGCRGLGKTTLAMLFGLLAFAAHGPSVAAGQPDAASFDLDADGVSNAMDSCPRIPNPPVNGQQPQLCGAALDTIIDDYTFLRSRTFMPVSGAVPDKDALPQKTRVHVLLHVRPSEQGIVLPAANRAALNELGVNLLDYVPHNTYYVSLPRSRIDNVVSMAFVQAVSAIIPEDRIAPDVRVRGPLYGNNADGSVNFEVSFFSDVSLQEQNAILASGAISHRHLYDTTHRVKASGATAVDWFAQRDAVAWIEDVPADNVDDTTNGQSATGADDVIDLLGLTGDGIVVSMIESGQIDPVPHPNMDGRVTLANNPIFAPADGSHASNVGAIMVADGSDGLGNNMGLLPEAELVGYSHAGLTIKRQNFGVPEEARNDYDALLTNFSYSQYNCSKVGDYTKRAKFQDKAAAEAGVVITKSAGNGRNGNSFIDKTPFTDCTMDLRSLPHAAVAKNSIVVGNMNVGSDSVSTLSGSSSSGPTADGRLKPDLVAPGAGLNSIDYDFDNNQAIASSFGGTSASAPFVSGVVGLLGETFDDNGIDPNTVPPARYKAILVHTARDEGPTGPDFRHGYGLVQPEQAVRIADEWDLWGREDSVDENTTSLAFSFDITSPHSFFKVTLAWDDEKGEHTSTLALKNDLDLTLISPSGVVHRPYDLDPPAAGSDIDPGATPCTVATCVDRLNNVEMVLAEAPVGFSEVEQGTWSAEVTVHRLVSNDQPFSLVLTPDCPILIDQDTVLSGDILCSSTSVDAVGIRISGAGVDLDCNGHKVESLSLVDGSRGIVSTADGVTIRRCLVQRFDTGIEAIEPSGAANDNLIVDNRVRFSGDFGISVEGNSHRVIDNTVYQMDKESGFGVRADGFEIDVVSNDFPLAYGLTSGADTIAVYVAPGSQLGSVDDNQFSGLWKYGIYLNGGPL